MIIISNDDEDNDNHGNYDSNYDAKGEGFDSTHPAESQQNTHTTPTRGKLPNIEANDDDTEDEDENDDDNHNSRGETHENNNYLDTKNNTHESNNDGQRNTVPSAKCNKRKRQQKKTKRTQET